MTEPIKLVPRNIREVWDDVRPGLEELKVTWPALCTWRVEDVYAAVLQEQAVLYLTEDGFAVCTLDTDEYSLQSELFIWIAYAYKLSRGGMLKKYLPSFIEVAKGLGCKGVSTRSNHSALDEMDDLETVYTHYRVKIDGEG